MCWSSGSVARHRPRGGAKPFHLSLHCMGPVMALTDESASVERTAAIRPAADINPLARRRCLG
jgi:hypothetical protein